MDKYYHFTSQANYDSILEKGLLPANGPRCKSIGDTNFGVFLSKGMDRAVHMYALMFGFYEKYHGPEGDIIIAKENEKIENLFKKKYSSENHIEIIKSKSKINAIYEIKKIPSFIDYLDGFGYYFSIDDLDDVLDDYPENCRYDKIIPPSKIKILSLINKYTGEEIYVHTAIVAYFMSHYSLEYMCSIVPEENKKDIERLYSCIYLFGFNNYNFYNYDLVERPIKNNKEKQQLNYDLKK